MEHSRVKKMSVCAFICFSITTEANGSALSLQNSLYAVCMLCQASQLPLPLTNSEATF